MLTGSRSTPVGHCHPAVVAAIRARPASSSTSATSSTTSRCELADGWRVPLGDGKVFFTNSGAEAIEAAIKLRARPGRGGDVVSVHRAFHGRTYGALSATPQESKQAPFAPLVPGFVAVPTAEALRAAVDDRPPPSDRAVQGESGVWPLEDDSSWPHARPATARRGADLRRDPDRARPDGHAVGLPADPGVPRRDHGRQGPRRRLADRRPVAGPALSEVFEPGDHGTTFGGGPVQCAAGLAALGVIDDDELLARVTDLGEQLAGALAELPGVTEVRGRGFMLAIDIAGGGAPALATRALKEKRLVLNATGPETIRLLPPLIAGQAEIDEALARLVDLLAV